MVCTLSAEHRAPLGGPVQANLCQDEQCDCCICTNEDGALGGGVQDLAHLAGRLEDGPYEQHPIEHDRRRVNPHPLAGELDAGRDDPRALVAERHRSVRRV
eukprot:scaffold30331_cov35-Tisochrysis_lutea.AAC.3